MLFLFRVAGSTFGGRFVCLVAVFAKLMSGIFGPCARKIVRILVTLVALDPFLMCCVGSTSPAALVANWNFNTLVIEDPSTPGSGDVPFAISASSGDGKLGKVSCILFWLCRLPVLRGVSVTRGRGSARSSGRSLAWRRQFF